MADGGGDGELAGFLKTAFACSAEVADSIGRHAAARRHAADELVVRQGDPLHEAFLMWLGRARAQAFTRDGQIVVLHEFLPGDLFGALDERPGEASGSEVVALEPSRMAVFQAIEFLALAERYGCVGLALSRSLLRQLRAATDRMVARTTLSAFGRIYAELLRLADLGDGRTIRPPPVLAALASRVQTTRETASRAVSALERRGVLRRDEAGLVIVARHRLEELVV